MVMAHLRSVNWLWVAQVISGITTPVIAGLAVVIALGQYRVNRLQHRLALFEKRMAIFNGTKILITAVFSSGECTLTNLHEFAASTRDSIFLFGPEIVKYLDVMYHKAVALSTKAKAPGEEALHTAVVGWFNDQFTVVETTFAPYLDFRNP